MVENRLVLRLRRGQLNSIICEVQRSYPIEACGVLFGSTIGEEILVEKVVNLRNILGSENLFQIDPEEFLAELMKAESEGLQHLGFFHSHQLNVKPSEMDLKYMRLWPEKIWLIASALNSKIAAYRVVDDKLHEVHIIVE